MNRRVGAISFFVVDPVVSKRRFLLLVLLPERERGRFRSFWSATTSRIRDSVSFLPGESGSSVGHVESAGGRLEEKWREESAL